MPQPCTITKTLQIAFTPPSTLPTNGYIVKWRIVGATTWNTVSPNPTNSPVNIAAVPACENIEGTIQTNCGGGNTGLVATFGATGTGFPPEYSLIRVTNCVDGNGNTTYTLTGHTGDTVVLRFAMSGVVAWNSLAGYAGITTSVTSGVTTDTDGSAHITATTSTGVTCSSTITFVMPSTSVSVTTIGIIHNSTILDVMSGNLEIVSVNGNTSTVSTAGCIGNSGGAW